MNYLNGGYVMLDKADSDIFAKASGALKAGKPILWYEDKNTCYFIDTIEKTGTDTIALTKGGLTIVITSGNVVTEKGTVNGAILDDIVDANGNKRFIDGDGTPSTIEGVDVSYCKWSLSGTHLMVVYAGSIDNGTALTNSQELCVIPLPDYVLDKIYAIIGSSTVLRTSLNFVGSDLSVQSASAIVNKGTSSLSLRHIGSTTLSANRSFRFQMDLLIDQE